MTGLRKYQDDIELEPSISSKDPIRDSGGATYSLDIAGDLTFVFCDHPVLYYNLE